MANANKPTGLTPVGLLHGGAWDGKVNVYYIPSTDPSAYAPGDPVTLGGTADANGVPSVVLATAGTGNAILGAVVGMGTKEGLMADPANLDSVIIPATKTKNYYVLVADDPNIIYEVQETAGNYTAADVGANANLASGVNNGYVSSWILDSSVASGTGSTIQLHLLGLARRQDNAFGAFAKWRVLINNHVFKAGTAGV